MQVAKLYTLDGILTVVDAKHILEHLLEEKPEGVENESVEQVLPQKSLGAFRDGVVILMFLFRCVCDNTYEGMWVLRLG